MILLILAVPVILISLWVYMKDRLLNYWDRKGVAQLQGTNLLFGDNGRVFKGGEALLDVIEDQYNDFKKQNVKFGGRYGMLGDRSLMILDPDLIKQIFLKDFDYFMDHGSGVDSKLDPLAKHLFNLTGNEWKNMRHKLSPTFSSGKIKTMFQILQLCTINLKEALNAYAENKDRSKEPIDIQDILARYTTDIIGNCAFGVECNSLKNPDEKFRYYGRQIFEKRRPFRFIKMKAIEILPSKVSKILNLKIMDPEVENFFLNMVKDNAEYREKNKIIRNDFFQLLLQLKNSTNLDANNSLTLEEIAAQCYVFFVGGFDTSSNLMSFALYELAENQDIQDKLRKSINDILNRYEGTFTYDAIQEMDYLDKVVNESIRKYPLGVALPRYCNKDYKIPNSDVVIEKGTRINIPVVGLHRDPDYYPDPMKFDPERFSKENIDSRPSIVYLPFGEGPRQCIGTRFGLLQSKMGLATIIKNFKITVNKEKSSLPLKIKPPGFISSPQDIYFNVEKI